jgi:hypothetical protein
MSTSTDPHRLREDHAPTPFSAAEIRVGCPTGRTLRLLVEPEDGEPLVRVIRFIDTDSEGASQESGRFTTSGAPLGDPERHRATWLDLQSHASFPAAATTIVDETERVFWFARALPGMPVRFEERVSGSVRHRTTLLDDVTPDGPMRTDERE